MPSITPADVALTVAYQVIAKGLHDPGARPSPGLATEVAGHYTANENLRSGRPTAYVYCWTTIERGGDGYASAPKRDPEAYETSIDWRQPVID